MAVIYANSGGGLFGSLLGGLGMAASFVPGMQAFAPYLMGAGAMANGDIAGGLGSMAAPMIGRTLDAAKVTAARDAMNRESLYGSLTDAARQAEGWSGYNDQLAASEFQRKWGRRRDSLDGLYEEEFRRMWGF
jgi:hypothetical protein